MSKFNFFSRHGKALVANSAFGNTNKEKAKFFASALLISSAGGLVISNIILTDERIETLSRTTAKAFERLGIRYPFNQAQAFSTADHGLHPPHFPWEFEKFYKTFDHSA
jgi:ubiquinol-cytochrome c reductase cytochrome c1 subunit